MGYFARINIATANANKSDIVYVEKEYKRPQRVCVRYANGGIGTILASHVKEIKTEHLLIYLNL